MAKRKSDAPTMRVPKLCKHKASGRGVVRLAGRDIYLGKFGTRECREAYREAIRKWMAGGAPTMAAAEADGLTLDELVAEWWPTLQRRYAGERGAKTLEKHRLTLQRFHEQFGGEPAVEFGPRKLVAFRTAMLKPGTLCRREVNARVQIIRRMFAWGVAHELLPADAAHALRAVENLRRGDGGRDSRKVGPVTWEHVEPVLAHVSREVAALIQLQWHCGARSGELLGLRPVDIERDGDDWLVRPAAHKTEHHGKERVIPLGPQAREVLRPFFECLPPPAPETPLFSPAKADAERSLARRLARQTPMTPSQRQRKRKRRPRVAPGAAYDAGSYGRAITRGIDSENAQRLREAMAAAVPECAETIERLPVKALSVKDAEDGLRVDRSRLQRACEGDAGACERAIEAAKAVTLVPHWHPHQLRHAFATRVRKEAGIEVARVLLGHSSPLVTEIYAEADRKVAVQAMERLG